MGEIKDLPVLILGYNRFDKFTRCISTLKKQGVNNIYVSIDGPKNEYDVKTNFIFIALSYSELNEIRKKKYLEAKNKGFKIASYVSSHATILIANNIGDNVTLWSGNHIGHHSVIGDHSFISSHVVISGGVKIGNQCFLGVNSTIRDHISIGSKSIIGAGALVLENLASNTLLKGIDQKISKVVNSSIKKL